MILYDSQNGEFTVNNTGGVSISVTNVVPDVGDYLITPSLPTAIAAGASQTFSINTEGGDLTGANVNVTTTCGSANFSF